MTQEVKVYPLASPWGRFSLYTFFIDAPEPAIVDSGIASSPAEGMAPALAALGRRIADVRWILLTHGHIDHVGGAYALRELTGGRAQVVIGAADAPLLRSRRAHVDEYLAGRGRYLRDADGAARVAAAALAVISGELEPAVLVTGGEVIPLGGGVTVSVHHLPGHTAGSVGYLLDGQRSVFAGDAVQIHGAANGFPSYMDPSLYRASLEYLRDEGELYGQRLRSAGVDAVVSRYAGAGHGFVQHFCWIPEFSLVFAETAAFLGRRSPAAE